MAFSRACGTSLPVDRLQHFEDLGPAGSPGLPGPSLETVTKEIDNEAVPHSLDSWIRLPGHESSPLTSLTSMSGRRPPLNAGQVFQNLAAFNSIQFVYAQ